MGLGYQLLTRLCAHLRPPREPLLPAQTLQELGLREGLQGPKGTPGTRLLRSAPRAAREAGRGLRATDALSAWKPRQPGPGGSYLRTWGARTLAAASGSRAAGAAGAAGGGRALGVAARNSPARLQGGAGRRRSATVTESHRHRPSFMPEFLHLLLSKFPNSGAVIRGAHANVVLTKFTSLISESSSCL